jgi:hypothetical protein
MVRRFADAWNECLPVFMESEGLDEESVGPFAENAMEWLDCWSSVNSHEQVEVQPPLRCGFPLAVQVASNLGEDLYAAFRLFVGSRNRLAKQTREALKSLRAEREDLRTCAVLCENLRCMVVGRLKTKGTRIAPGVPLDAIHCS